MNLTERRQADRNCIRTTNTVVSGRWTASAATCVKEELMPLCHQVPTAVILI